mmetsp:Transcript_39333/g.98973  ORF Transcript_39333/g.98973 Transcript_39333/m.98973 type:complete len:220 (+) Transcript_39333:1856-2515(+)
MLHQLVQLVDVRLLVEVAPSSGLRDFRHLLDELLRRILIWLLFFLASLSRLNLPGLVLGSRLLGLFLLLLPLATVLFLLFLLGGYLIGDEPANHFPLTGGILVVIIAAPGAARVGAVPTAAVGVAIRAAVRIAVRGGVTVRVAAARIAVRGAVRGTAGGAGLSSAIVTRLAIRLVILLSCIGLELRRVLVVVRNLSLKVFIALAHLRSQSIEGTLLVLG